MARLRTKYRDSAAEVPALEVEAATDNPAVAASTLPDGSGSLLGEQLAAQRKAERLARMAERIDVPPPSGVDSAIDEARDQSINLDRHTTPDLDTRDDGGDLDTTLRKLGLPNTAIEWMKIHPQVLYDPDINAQAQHLHHDLLREGLGPYTDKYFLEMERRIFGTGAVPGMSADEVAEAVEHHRGRLDNIGTRLNELGSNPDPDELDQLERQIDEHRSQLDGLQDHLSALPDAKTSAVDRALAEARGAKARPVQVEPTRRVAPVSAPPSREAPSWSNGQSMSRNTRITLTPQQREAARIAGISETEYARNLLRLQDEKAKGHYGGAP